MFQPAFNPPITYNHCFSTNKNVAHLIFFQKKKRQKHHFGRVQVTTPGATKQCICGRLLPFTKTARWQGLMIRLRPHRLHTTCYLAPPWRWRASPNSRSTSPRNPRPADSLKHQKSSPTFDKVELFQVRWSPWKQKILDILEWKCVRIIHRKTPIHRDFG